MYLKMVAAIEIGQAPWISLTMKRGLAVALDDKTCQARQGQGVVARIDRGHVRLQFRLSFKLHFRRESVPTGQAMGPRLVARGKSH